MYRRKESVPRKRSKEHDGHVRSISDHLLMMSGQTIASDISIYAVDQRRGRYKSHKRWITIPKWALVAGKGPGYDFYYIAHELAHAIVDQMTSKLTYGGMMYMDLTPHGSEFMKAFKKVCPEKYWHYELGYKPRNARMAGISEK